ncbi:LysR family transcriptional regulator [Brevibacillus sp. H7]|jgi:DNA-binding transcriptional LysR family regulator|uniref:LysR family transcriptional regulator n=1 Tax=Brevibacillus sp. H7 TaxID=3349138 RepID=UPI0037F4D098
MFRFEQLTYFVTTVEKGSLNKAAKALYISQPALTKQLAQLESQLACVLFHRRMTGIELTEAGRYFYERACMILEQVEQTVEGIKRFSRQNPLRIGALPSIANYYLPDIIAAYTEDEQSRVSITVRDTTSELVALLEQGSLDLAFAQDFAGHAELPGRELFQEPYLAVLPAHHPMAEQETVDFLAFCREKLLIHRDPCDIRSNFRRYCNKLGIQPENVLELDFNDSLLTYAAKGQGLTFVPQMMAEGIRDPHLTVRPFEQPFTRTIDVIFQRDAAGEVEQLCLKKESAS